MVLGDLTCRHCGGWGGVSLASLSPSPHPTHKAFSQAQDRCLQTGKSTSKEEGRPLLLQPAKPCASVSLLLRMCPERPAWDLESHRAQPTHRPLLFSVQWKTWAWDTWTLVSGQGTTKTAPCCWLRTTVPGGPGDPLSAPLCPRARLAAWWHQDTGREDKAGEDGWTQARRGATLSQKAGGSGATGQFEVPGRPFRTKGVTGKHHILPEVGSCGLQGS